MKNGQKWSKMVKNDQYLIKNDQKTTKNSQKQKNINCIFLFIIKLNIKKMMKNCYKTLYFDQKRTKIIK